MLIQLTFTSVSFHYDELKALCLNDAWFIALYTSMLYPIKMQITKPVFVFAVEVLPWYRTSHLMLKSPGNSISYR